MVVLCFEFSLDPIDESVGLTFCVLSLLWMIFSYDFV